MRTSFCSMCTNISQCRAPHQQWEQLSTAKPAVKVPRCGAACDKCGIPERSLRSRRRSLDESFYLYPHEVQLWELWSVTKILVSQWSEQKSLSVSRQKLYIYIYKLKQVLQKCWEVLLGFQFCTTHGGIYNGSAHVSTAAWGDAPWDQRELSSLKETLLLDLLNSWQNLQLITQCWKLCHRNHLMKVLCHKTSKCISNKFHYISKSGLEWKQQSRPSQWFLQALENLRCVLRP